MLRRSIYFLFLYLILSCFILGQELTIERLYSDPSLIGSPPKSPLWSSDESLCAFLWNEDAGRIYNLYLFSPASDLKPQRLTSFEKRGISEFIWGRGREEIFYLRGTSVYVYNLRSESSKEIIENKKRMRSIALSPDKKSMSYILEGNLWLFDIENGEIRQLTSFDSKKEEIGRSIWSPDSRRIAVFHQELDKIRRVKIPDFRREEIRLKETPRPFPGDPINKRKVGIITLPDGNIQWINLYLDTLRSLKWSPSGKALLLEVSSEFANKRDIFLADMENIGINSIYHEESPLNTTSWIWQSEWIDENRIALTSDKEGFCHLYTLDIRNKKANKITSGNWEIFRIFPIKDKNLYFIANRSAAENRDLLKVNLESRKVEKVGKRGGVYRPYFSRTGKQICVLFSDDMTPFDLYYVREGELKRVSSSPLPEFYEYRWIKTKYLDIESPRDGAKIRAKILFPPGFNPKKQYPAIIGSVYANAVLNQWGGRDAHPTWGLDQYLVQVEQYILMNIDIRGSVGYGRKFREDMLKGYGVSDIEDLATAAEYLKTLPYIKKDKIGIWGSSYGGLLTLMCLFKKPGLFACGIAGAPASNVYHAFPSQMQVMKSAEDKEAYQNSSAYHWSKGLKAPVMIIHGIKDRVVLFMDSVSLVKKMIREGKDVEFVVLPEAYHGWDKGPSFQTQFAFKKMIDFFSRHLKKS